MLLLPLAAISYYFIIAQVPAGGYMEMMASEASTLLSAHGKASHAPGQALYRARLDNL